MTVAELIEELQQLPGASDIRHVVVSIVVHRPYAKAQAVVCSVADVTVDSTHAVIKAYGYIE